MGPSVGVGGGGGGRLPGGGGGFPALLLGQRLGVGILNGECDDLPESAFLFAGTIDDVFAKAKKG